MTDIDYMQRALDLALRAKGSTSPNPLVGAVIVKGNKIIAEGWHRRCGGDHAEITALKKAGRRARGARMYVTLEPCHHYGRTPPCVDQIIESGVREVIVGMKDPNPLTDGKSVAKLRRAGIKVKVGFLQNELKAANEIFLKYVQKNMPFVAVKSAQSLDGKIALSNGESKWITSQAARKYARKIRDEFDAILVGVNTVLKDDPRLSGSRKTKRIKKIILDSSLRISPKANLFSGTVKSDVIIATTEKSSKRKQAQFEKKGAQLIVCPQRRGKIDLKWLFKELARREITSILVEGGAQVIGSVLKLKLADKMYCYIAPIVIGDQKALSSAIGLNPVQVNQTVSLKDLEARNIGRDILIEGYFKN